MFLLLIATSCDWLSGNTTVTPQRYKGRTPDKYLVPPYSKCTSCAVDTIVDQLIDVEGRIGLYKPRVDSLVGVIVINDTLVLSP